MDSRMDSHMDGLRLAITNTIGISTGILTSFLVATSCRIWAALLSAIFIGVIAPTLAVLMLASIMPAIEMGPRNLMFAVLMSINSAGVAHVVGMFVLSMGMYLNTPTPALMLLYAAVYAAIHTVSYEVLTRQKNN